jgi:hypothetical protein
MLMKKWVVLAVAMTMVAGAQAKEKGKAKGGSTASVTKAAFMETQKKKMEAAGVAFDQAKVEAAFATQDKNGDGVLTADEQTPAKGKHKGKKK